MLASTDRLPSVQSNFDDFPKMIDIYEVLEVGKETPLVDLKSRCQSCLLKLHPDKNKGKESEEFLEIQKVWKIVSNEDSFATYLAEKSAELNSEVRPIWKTIQSEEMTRTGDVFSYQCRCGGEFSFDSLYEVMEEELILLECDTCSLMLEVNNTSAS